MKRISIIFLALMLFLTASSADGQTRRRTTTRKSRPATTRSAETPAQTQTAASRVAEQIKSLGRFLYLYGPIWKELQSSEAAARNNQSAAAAIEQNRAKLRDAFHNYRVRMDELETLFSDSAELRPYYARLMGVAAGASAAEESVSTGRYDQAGRSLLEVMNRLTDVLLEMRAR